MLEMFPIPVLLALLFGLALCFPLLHFVFVQKVQPEEVPHGSMGWPFLGETVGFLKPHKSNSVGTFLQEHCSRYGRIFKSHLFGCPTIVSCDLELNTFILQNEEKLFRSSFPKPVHDIVGELSLMIVSGDLHKKLRSVAIGFIMTTKSRPDFLSSIEKFSISVMESWIGRQEIAFFKQAKELTLYLMLKNLLDIEPEDPSALRIFEAFLTFMKGFVSVPLYVPGTPYAKAVKARARISSTIKEIFIERERRKVVGLPKSGYLEEIVLNGNLSDEEKVSIVLDLLLGGYETTAGILALVIYFLGQAPSVLQTLMEEHHAIRRRKREGEPMNWEDYKKMEFTSNVISEALRCGNLVKFLHRKAIQDVKFKGYLIPAGWQVLPVFAATHLDPSIHENPSEFNPWRWADQAMNKKVTPFGGGLRVCPGMELAKVEIAFFLHHLILNYRWKTKEDDYPISYPYLDFSRGLVLEIEPLKKRM